MRSLDMVDCCDVLQPHIVRGAVAASSSSGKSSHAPPPNEKRLTVHEGATTAHYADYGYGKDDDDDDYAFNHGNRNGEIAGSGGAKGNGARVSLSELLLQGEGSGGDFADVELEHILAEDFLPAAQQPNSQQISSQQYVPQRGATVHAAAVDNVDGEDVDSDFYHGGTDGDTDNLVAEEEMKVPYQARIDRSSTEYQTRRSHRIPGHTPQSHSPERRIDCYNHTTESTKHQQRQYEQNQHQEQQQHRQKHQEHQQEQRSGAPSKVYFGDGRVP